jgi:hypothetical protein
MTAWDAASICCTNSRVNVLAAFIIAPRDGTQLDRGVRSGELRDSGAAADEF